MKRLGPVESPVVQQAVRKRQANTSRKNSFRWAIINMLVAAAMYLDLSFGPAFAVQHLLQPFIWYIECLLAVVFSLNVLVNLLSYCSFLLGTSHVELNPFQWQLLGVKESEPGFCTPKRSTGTGSSDPGLVISPTATASHSYTAAAYSPTNSPFPTMAAGYSPPQGSLSPSPNRSLSPGYSPSYSPGAAGGGSFLQNTPLLNKSTSFNQSGHAAFNRSSMMSPNNSTVSPMFRENDSSLGLRSRFNHSLKNSPLASEDCIKDIRELDDFLREQEEKERKVQAGSPDMTNGSATGGSFWSYNRSLADFSPLLRKYTYQLACRSPQSTAAKDDDTDDGPAHYHAQEVWFRAGVNVDDVDVWIEYLRKWLGQTIMSRLVREIETVNKSLARHGSEDMKVGEVSISNLKQLAVTKGQHVPTLNTLLPFLEVVSNQDYLVTRINELGKGGCMSDFRWNGGSTYKGKPWAENLPTDAEIVMHMLCSYMDARLPGHPKYYGKTFSTLHFLKTPDVPDLNKKDNMLIYQTKINPPHYKVVLGDDIWNLPKGRNNMFYAILLFLHHVKEKQHGMLGRVNLGLSGINMLWILDTHL